MNTEPLKAMLASDWSEKFVRFPLIVQPKYDGVRGLPQCGALYARSLKLIPNRHLQKTFSAPELQGLDGELCTGDPTDPDLMQKTTSMVGSFDKVEPTVLHVFDLLDGSSSRLHYHVRRQQMADRVEALQAAGFPVRVMPSHMVHSMDELLALDDQFLDAGYEGTILRDPYAVYKHGRSTAREGFLTRIKRFVDTEGVVEKLIQGTTNTNVAQTNELGRTFRSTAQAGKVGVERIGAFDVRNLESGEIHRVSAGKFKEVELVDMYHRPDRYVGKVLKYKFFPKGMVNKPRFPGALGWRDPIDMS